MSRLFLRENLYILFPFLFHNQAAQHHFDTATGCQKPATRLESQAHARVPKELQDRLARRQFTLNKLGCQSTVGGRRRRFHGDRPPSAQGDGCFRFVQLKSFSSDPGRFRNPRGANEHGSPRQARSGPVLMMPAPETRLLRL